MRRLLLSVAWFAPAAALHAAPTMVPGLGSIADRYDAFLLDQFGVLHDGKRAVPGAVECFENLFASRKRLIVLSNTSRRRAFALKKLPALGFEASHLTGFVTSGEAAWEHVRTCFTGKRCLWISWDETFMAWDPQYLDGLDVRLADAADADFVLLQGSQCMRGGSTRSTGLFETGEAGEALLAELKTCAARGLPMVCANPDLTVRLPDGSTGHMPGKIAAVYEQLLAESSEAAPAAEGSAEGRKGEAGYITYFGKPYRPAFDEALRLLGPDIDPSRVLHCGDSLHHDVAGANAAGIHSLFVAGGIHADDLPPEGQLSSEALSRLFDEEGIAPTLSVEKFVW